MPFTSITKPAVGDPTRKSLADAIIDNLAFLNSVLNSGGAGIVSQVVVNGSFEYDSDSDAIPDGWTRTLYTGGSSAIETSDQHHGKKAFKFTSPGGGGNGGGYLTSTDFIHITPARSFALSWELKSSVAGVLNKVEVLWYDASEVYISASTLYDSSNNPTSWTLQSGVAAPPSTARLAKIRITGCHDSNTTAGSTWFDNLFFSNSQFLRRVTYDTPGTYTWVCPAGVAIAYVTCVGAGGGGGGGNSGTYQGSGGGGGGSARTLLSVTPGASYAIVVGAGGTGGTAGNQGASGTNSTWQSTVVIGNAGGGGRENGGTVGAGGSGTGTEVYPGESGDVGTTGPAVGGRGGMAQLGGAGGYKGPNAAAGGPGNLYGGGGGGGLTGGNGAPGALLIEF